MEYIIKTADNGWMVTWKEEDETGEMVDHAMLFEDREDLDYNLSDPEALLWLLFFIKEEVCGHYFSKHKQRNIVIHFDTEEEEDEAVIQ